MDAIYSIQVVIMNKVPQKKIGIYTLEERRKRILKYKLKMRKRREKIPLVKGYGSRKEKIL